MTYTEVYTLSHDKNRVYEKSIVYTHEQIVSAIKELSSSLNVVFDGDNVLIVPLLKGGMVFFGHLLTRLNFTCNVDYVDVSRYGRGTVGGDLRWNSGPNESVVGKTVLLVDDMCDTGETLRTVKAHYEILGAARVLSAVLINRYGVDKVYKPDFYGLRLAGEAFIFGFGIDYKGIHRNLPDICMFQRV